MADTNNQQVAKELLQKVGTVTKEEIANILKGGLPTSAGKEATGNGA